MSTAKKTTKTAADSNAENKRVGYFYWCGETAMDEVIAEQGLPLDCATADIAKIDLADFLESDSDMDGGYVFRITVERVLKAAKSPIVFTKVE
jgi:hypothetical protein